MIRNSNQPTDRPIRYDIKCIDVTNRAAIVLIAKRANKRNERETESERKTKSEAKKSDKIFVSDSKDYLAYSWFYTPEHLRNFKSIEFFLLGVCAYVKKEKESERQHRKRRADQSVKSIQISSKRVFHSFGWTLLCVWIRHKHRLPTFRQATNQSRRNNSDSSEVILVF